MDLGLTGNIYAGGTSVQSSGGTSESHIGLETIRGITSALNTVSHVG